MLRKQPKTFICWAKGEGLVDHSNQIDEVLQGLQEP